MEGVQSHQLSKERREREGATWIQTQIDKVEYSKRQEGARNRTVQCVPQYFLDVNQIHNVSGGVLFEGRCSTVQFSSVLITCPVPSVSDWFQNHIVMMRKMHFNNTIEVYSELQRQFNTNKIITVLQSVSLHKVFALFFTRAPCFSYRV